MKRSGWKLPFFKSFFLTDKFRYGKVDFSTTDRSSTILGFFVRKKILIHSGKKFISIFVTKPMIGHKLGEFSLTKIRGVAVTESLIKKGKLKRKQKEKSKNKGKK